MAVALQPLPTPRDKSYQDFHLIPFSDYSKWERRPVKKPEAVVGPKLRSRGLRQLGPVQWTSSGKPKLLPEQTDTVRGEKASNASTIRTKISIKSQEPPQIKIMKSEVISRRSSLEVYRKYAKDLLAENVSIISSIMELEVKTQCSTDKTLERYKHFKGALYTLKFKSEEMLAEAEEELETTRSRLYDQVEAHRAEVAEVDKAIEASTRELQLLKHYKDKEYPVRQIRIEQLKETQEESQSTQMDQLEEIEMQVAEEREQYQQQLEAKKLQLETEAAEACMAQVKKSVRLQAMQNKIMRKELSIHQKKQQELNEAIVELKNALSCMRLEARDQKRNHLPPVTVQTKCLPDTEVILNIPMASSVTFL